MTRKLNGNRYAFIIEAEAAEPEPPQLSYLFRYDEKGSRLVDDRFVCPQCHERRMDYLIPDHNAVRCESCGTVYEL